jgi:hypothetical protein
MEPMQTMIEQEKEPSPIAELFNELSSKNEKLEKAFSHLKERLSPVTSVHESTSVCCDEKEDLQRGNSPITVLLRREISLLDALISQVENLYDAVEV